MSDLGKPDSLQTDRRGETRARKLIDEAGSTLKHEARTFAEVAQDRVRAEAQRGTQAAGRTLGDFANAVRRAGDELGQADQTPSSRLVLKAADGLETFSRSLADKDPGDLLNAVRDFGRRHPIAFIGGAVLAGLAVGRFARASDRDAAGHDEMYDDDAYGDVGPGDFGADGFAEVAPAAAHAAFEPAAVATDTDSEPAAPVDPTNPGVTSSPGAR